MNLSQLRAFDAVAKVGSFSQAAEVLAVTQPAVTMQIRELERDCGVQLFERIRRAPRLTAAGVLLHDYVRRIFSLLEEAGRRLEGARGLTSGRLRVVAGPTGAVYAAELLAAFHERHPGIQVALNVDTSERVAERLVTLVDDLGLLGQEQHHPLLARDPFCDDQLVLICAPSHPWGRRRTIAIRDLAGVPLMVRETTSTTRAFLESRLAAAGQRVRIGLELGSNEAIKRAVERAAGVAIISREVVQAEVRAGTLKAVRISDTGFVHRIDLVYHVDRAQAPVIAAARQTAQARRPGAARRIR
jgi:DNA-binding transcriptional LysR family regulator